MARQTGAIKIRGTIGGLTFYKMEGSYYVRRKSSLTSKRFFGDKAFEGSRRSCSRFALGNKIASRLYRMVEEEKRKYKLYCFLKKKAIALLKQGKSIAEAEEALMDYLAGFGLVIRPKPCKSLVKRQYKMYNNNILILKGCVFCKEVKYSIYLGVGGNRVTLQLWKD